MGQKTNRRKYLRKLCQFCNTNSHSKVINNKYFNIENNDWKLLEKLNFDHETFKLLKRYRKFRDALTINLDNDIILKGNRIILPEIFHKISVKLAHIRLQGIQKTKALVQSKSFSSVWTILFRRKLLIVYPVKQLVDPTLQ